MSRLLSELEDKQWFPPLIRRYMTDYLQFLFSNFNLYSPVTEIIHDILIQTRQKQIVDLCSGSGGPLLKIRKDYFRRYGSIPGIVLTDKFHQFGNTNHFAPGITYYPESVNAMDIPITLTGVRTMFSSLHHFTTEELKLILSDAVNKKQPVAFFDSADKNLIFIIALIILHPLLLFIFTPFFKPFEFKRLLFTYLIPLVIIGSVWDGIVSILHLHSFKSLSKLIKESSLHGFDWKIIQIKNLVGMKINGVIGTP
jgi:hypothetical protein